jgi:hypothetical protein
MQPPRAIADNVPVVSLDPPVKSVHAAESEESTARTELTALNHTFDGKPSTDESASYLPAVERDTGIAPSEDGTGDDFCRHTGRLVEFFGMNPGGLWS